ncbi:MAG: hypothetical protein AB7E30_03470 [Lawsonibacter sp.]
MMLITLHPRLSAHNQVVWRRVAGDPKDAAATDVYITSVNALAETGKNFGMYPLN